MLPNFLIIGVQKSATTWLDRCLGEHPDVLMSAPKETYYFTTNLNRGLDWYETHFSEYRHEHAVGEASPGYIIHPEVPEMAKELLGEDIKIIVCFRHPVDRAYSAFGHYIREGNLKATSDFKTLFREDYRKLRRRGYYSEDLKNYLAHFDRSQFLFLVYEEVNADNLKALRESFEFLEVASDFIPPSLNRRVNKGMDHRLFHGQLDWLRRRISGMTYHLPARYREPILEFGRLIYHKAILGSLPKVSEYTPLDPELRQTLLKEFVPDIHQLEDLIGKDLSLWYAPKG